MEESAERRAGCLIVEVTIHQTGSSSDGSEAQLEPLPMRHIIMGEDWLSSKPQILRNTSNFKQFKPNAMCHLDTRPAQRSLILCCYFCVMLFSGVVSISFYNNVQDKHVIGTRIWTCSMLWVGIVILTFPFVIAVRKLRSDDDFLYESLDDEAVVNHLDAVNDEIIVENPVEDELAASLADQEWRDISFKVGRPLFHFDYDAATNLFVCGPESLVESVYQKAAPNPMITIREEAFNW